VGAATRDAAGARGEAAPGAEARELVEALEVSKDVDVSDLFFPELLYVLGARWIGVLDIDLLRMTCCEGWLDCCNGRQGYNSGAVDVRKRRHFCRSGRQSL